MNFSYVWKDKIAGSAHPGRGRELSDHLNELHNQGIRGILSLTEEPLDFAPLREFEMNHLHLPVVDFSAPNPQQIDEAVQFMQGHVDEGQGVLVHCRAGIGRTGTILACYLVSRGLDAEQAIAEVRRERPGSLEVYAQEYCVYRYAEKWQRHHDHAGDS